MRKRVLAAIMFTDMVGYRLLMQRDETKRSPQERSKNVVDEHDGKILQYYGDGPLIIFNSSIGTVACGIQMPQKQALMAFT